MKKTLLALLLSATAFAAPAPLPDQGGQVINLLKNNQFSQGRTGITASVPTTYTLITGANAISGTSGQFLPTANAQTLTSDSYAAPGGLGGGACLLAVPYRSSESTNLVNAQVLDGSNNPLSPVVPFTRNIGPSQPLYIPFQCPATAATVKFRLTSTGTASALVIDNLHLGSENRTIQVSQAANYGSAIFAGTASCAWLITSSTVGDLPANASCPFPTVTGRLVASATKTPSVEAPNAPAGVYDVTFVSGFVEGHSGTDCHYQVTDESNAKVLDQMVYGTTATLVAGLPLRAVFNYASSGSHTFKIRASSTDNSTTCGVTNGTAQGGFIVNYYPSASQTLVAASGQAAYWSGQIDGPSWTTTSGTYSDGSESGAVVVTERKNVNFGTVLKAAGVAGFTFSFPKLGGYEVCAQTAYSNSVSAQSSVFNITDGSSIIAEINGYGGASYPAPMTLCGIYQVTSLAPITLKMQGKGTAGATTTWAGGAAIFGVTVKQLDAGQAAPVFPGTVSSGSAGQSLIQGAFLSGSGIVYNASSNWIVLNTHPGSGHLTYTISGFSGTPHSCHVTGFDNGASITAHIENMTSSALVVHLALGVTPTDLPHTITCFGPK